MSNLEKQRNVHQKILIGTHVVFFVIIFLIKMYGI
jgi:hypothetical protein